MHAFFPGCTVNGVTYLPTDSRLAPGYQFDAFVQILPVQPFLSCTCDGLQKLLWQLSVHVHGLPTVIRFRHHEDPKGEAQS